MSEPYSVDDHDYAVAYPVLEAKLAAAEERIRQLKGTLEYIEAQSKLDHPGVLSCIHANARAALDDNWQSAVAAAITPKEN